MQRSALPPLSSSGSRASVARSRDDRRSAGVTRPRPLDGGDTPSSIASRGSRRQTGEPIPTQHESSSRQAKPGARRSMRREPPAGADETPTGETPGPSTGSAREDAADAQAPTNDEHEAQESAMPAADGGPSGDSAAAQARLRPQGSSSSDGDSAALQPATDEPPAMQWDQLDPSPLDRAFDTGYSSGRLWDQLSGGGAAGDTKPPRAAWEDVPQVGGLGALTYAVVGRALSPSGTTIAAIVACLLFLVALGGGVALTVVCLYEGRCGEHAIPSATPVADTLFVIFSMGVLLGVVPLVAVALSLHRQGPLAWAVLFTGLTSAATFVTGIVALADTADSNVRDVSAALWPALSQVQRAHFRGSESVFRESLAEGSAVYGSLGFVFGVLLSLVALGCAYLYFAWGGWWEDKLCCCCPVGGGRLAGGDMDAARGMGVFGGGRRQEARPRGSGASAAQTPSAAAGVGDAKGGAGGVDAEAPRKPSRNSGADEYRRMGMPREVQGGDAAGGDAVSGGAPERKPGGRSATDVVRAGSGRGSGRRRGAGAGEGANSTPQRTRGGWRRQTSSASGESNEDSAEGGAGGGPEGARESLLSSPGRAAVSRSRIPDA